MPIICIILLSFLAIFAFFGLVFLLCKYCLKFSTKEFIKHEKQKRLSRTRLKQYLILIREPFLDLIMYDGEARTLILIYCILQNGETKEKRS